MEPVLNLMLAEHLAKPTAEAAEFLRADRLAIPPDQTPPEAALRRAFHLAASDIATIRQLSASEQPADIVTLFGNRFDEKIAALLLLTKLRLLDALRLPADWLDIQESARDLVLFLDILFRAGAAEGLGVIHDFAASQLARGASGPGDPTPRRWEQVCHRCLSLMAFLPDSRIQVLAFLKAREVARRGIEQLMASPDPAIADAARMLGTDYVQARKSGILADAPPAPAPYVILAREHAVEDEAQWPLGLASLLFAHDRIRDAVNAGDHATLIHWMARGSAAAAADAFRTARAGLPTIFYARLLDQFFSQEQVEPVRVAAAVLELGAVNRAANREGGEDELNRILYEATLTDDGYRAMAARMAVNELGVVDAFNIVLNVIENAPIVEVAEEGIRVLRDLRRLLMAETIVRRRITLAAAFDRARETIRMVQNVLEAAFSAPNAEAAHLYIERLREIKAYPELQQLAQKKGEVSALAKQTLSQFRLSTNPDVSG